MQYMQSALSNVAYQRDSCGGNNDTAWHLQETEVKDYNY